MEAQEYCAVRGFRGSAKQLKDMGEGRALCGVPSPLPISPTGIVTECEDNNWSPVEFRVILYPRWNELGSLLGAESRLRA